MVLLTVQGSTHMGHTVQQNPKAWPDSSGSKTLLHLRNILYSDVITRLLLSPTPRHQSENVQTRAACCRYLQRDSFHRIYLSRHLPMQVRRSVMAGQKSQIDSLTISF